MDTSNISVVHNISTERQKNCTSVWQQKESLSSESNCHFETFIQQVLAHAPESEKKIWARIESELDI